MKKILKKIIIILFICIMLTEFYISSGINIGTSLVSYADEDVTAVTNVINSVITGLGNIMEGILGILTYRERIMFLGIAIIIERLGSAVASVAGNAGGITVLTPGSVFFNKYNITNIDFFNTSSNSIFTQTLSQNIMVSIRDNIATWYYIMLMIASSILIAILIYVGIRMVISTVASEKAKYKKMLIDWFTSLALLYVLHFIIIATLKVNNALVAVLESVGYTSIRKFR